VKILKLKTILLHIQAKDIKNGNYDKEGGPLSETDVEDVKTTPSLILKFWVCGNTNDQIS
tara:strand:- start:814 stop:993 length:180 start_codon:yes stop_codon:yes gene_type:complete